MLSRSRNALAAIAVALMPFPGMQLLDYLNRGCGDGLCGFFSGSLLLGGLAVATLYLVTRSARHGEKPAMLRLIPFALWLLAMAPLTV